MKNRLVKKERNTKETQITIEIDLESKGPVNIDTGLPFFDHILTSMAFHGGFHLDVKARGDIEVDPHHLVEDTGIVLGQVLGKTVDEYGAVDRYGHAIIPMDDALCEVVIDMCRRPYSVMDIHFPQDRVGTFDVSLISEFLLGLANNAPMNLHCLCRYGRNSHHIAEALFKALGRSLKKAFSHSGGKGTSAMSTKGSI